MEDGVVDQASSRPTDSDVLLALGFEYGQAIDFSHTWLPMEPRTIGFIRELWKKVRDAVIQGGHAPELYETRVYVVMRRSKGHGETVR